MSKATSTQFYFHDICKSADDMTQVCFEEGPWYKFSLVISMSNYFFQNMRGLHVLRTYGDVDSFELFYNWVHLKKNLYSSHFHLDL